MTKHLNVLLIEDNDEHARIISRHIRRADRFTVNLVREGRLHTGLSRLTQEPDSFDILLLDLRLPDSDSHETLHRALSASAKTPIVVLSSLEDRDLAIQAVHEGAQDYLFKSDLSAEVLVRSVYAAIERKSAEIQIRYQMRQNRALFELGQFSAHEANNSSFLQKSVALIGATLEVDRVEILEFTSDQRTLKWKAGIGWNEINGERTVINDGLNDIQPHEALMITNIHGFSNRMSVIIAGKDDTHRYGILNVFSRQTRVFTAEEASFLLTAANTLSATILRRNLEDELKRRIEELNFAQRRKDEFLATLSHELGTPLNVIIGYAELLEKSAESWPPELREVREGLEAIERNARVEARLVSDVLEMSRIITGKMKLETTLFPLNRVIESAIKSIELAAFAKQITIETSLQGDMPRIYGDENRLLQVFWNLLANAVKFTLDHGHIQVTARTVGPEFEITVIDTGIGINAEQLPHVFEKFWQEDTSVARPYMGLGIGLSIVKHIVELHGGTVQVRSEGKGRGSTFTVRLPLNANAGAAIFKREATTTATDAPIPLRPTTAAPGTLINLRILAVDDSVESLNVLGRMLKKQGASVSAFSSPAAAIEEACSGNYDVLISDIGMPEINGYELLKRLRTWETLHGRKPLPAIAFTAYASATDAKNALDAGFQLHLSKPVSYGGLINGITTVMRN